MNSEQQEAIKIASILGWRFSKRNLELAAQILSLLRANSCKVPELKVLSDEEMLQPIWNMGVKLEKEGRQPDQIDRFRAIAQAQLDSIKRQIEEYNA